MGFFSFGAWVSSTPAPKSTKVKVAMCQMLCKEDKKENIETAEKMVSEACENGAELVILPECWNSPYDTSCFPVYAETIPSDVDSVDKASQPSSDFLFNIARSCVPIADNIKTEV